MRALWIIGAPGSAAAIRPDIALAQGLVKAGVHLELIVPPDSPWERAATEAGLEVVGSRSRGWVGGRRLRWLREGCEAAGIQLVHLLDRPAAWAALPALAKLQLGVLLRCGRPGGVQRWNPLARMAELHPRVDCVVCTAETIRAELARRRHADSVALVRPGYAAESLQGPPFSLASLGIPAEAMAVALTADYQPRKGVEHVIDALQWLPPGAPLHLLLLGAGLETRSVLERIARSPLRRQVHLLGDREDAPRIAAACAVITRGTLKREGIPGSVLTAMAAGVVPVLTDTGGARELVVQGESGILVPPGKPRAMGEALAWLLAHPTARQAMGEAARARVAAEFSHGAALDAHLALYRAMCGGGPIMQGPAASRDEGTP